MACGRPPVFFQIIQEEIQEPGIAGLAAIVFLLSLFLFSIQ
jgi:hypothetical protein